MESKPLLLHARFEEKFERGMLPIEYDQPIPPLEIENIHTADGLEIPSEDLELLLSCAKWEVCPPLPRTRPRGMACLPRTHGFKRLIAHCHSRL